MERGFRVHSINPKQLDRFRDRFSPAGAKDDSRDAEVLGDALRTDPRCFRALQPFDPVVVELREGSRMAEDLKTGAQPARQPRPGALVALRPADALLHGSGRWRPGPGWSSRAALLLTPGCPLCPSS